MSICIPPIFRCATAIHYRKQMAARSDPTDDGVKFRQDLKSETGFETYEEWLYQYGLDHPYLLWLRRGREFSWPVCCTLVDLSDCADSSIAIRIRDEGVSGFAGSAPALLDALRQPTQSIRLRVLLWWVDQRGPVTPELLDVCGLGLKIGPQFFEALAELTDRWSSVVHRGRGVRPFQPGQSQHYTVIGTHVVTISRNYISVRADTPPVLVIVGWNDQNWSDDELQLHVSYRQARSDWYLDETPPFQFRRKLDEQQDIMLENESLHSRSRLYTATLGQLLNRADCAAIRAADLLLLSMMPLLHIDTLQMRAKTRSLRRLIFSAFTSKSSDLAQYNVMKDERFWLRRHIEDSEAAKNNFVGYLRAQGSELSLDGTQYLNVDGLWRDALHEARRLENEVRDSMSIQAGQQSLEESKKSIELTNLQIEESRRVRIITVLAFIYVPLTTVTSIYGMNIQQINGSGHHIRIFVVTAVVALLTTGFSWFLIEGIYKVRAWRARIEEAVPQGRFKYGLAIRVYMIFWLIKTGHSRWMWKTNAWWQIIINSGSEFRPPGSFGVPQEATTACEYVSSPSNRRRKGAWFHKSFKQ